VTFHHSPGAPGHLNATSDADLLHLYTAGDKEAFAELYQRHRARLWAVAARIAGDHDADDAVQNAMLRAYHCADSFRGDSAVATWLHRIVVNAAIDITRHRLLPVAEHEAAEPPGASRRPIPGWTCASSGCDCQLTTALRSCSLTSWATRWPGPRASSASPKAP
jgi:DNA-directed RNA polymerase specialized sigma24 family protein